MSRHPPIPTLLFRFRLPQRAGVNATTDLEEADRGLEPINRAKTINLDKHELKALFERNATERDDAQAAERVEGMG